MAKLFDEDTRAEVNDALENIRELIEHETCFTYSVDKAFNWQDTNSKLIAGYCKRLLKALNTN